MNDLISVVVPIYNVQDYLEKCVDSILTQTYKKLEIILVDDGSPDNCNKICDDYCEKDTRVKVIHKENGGLSDARNAGINIATGKYIIFIDSDDYIHPQTIELLWDVLQNNQADIAVCGFKNVDIGFQEDNIFYKDTQAIFIEEEQEKLQYFVEEHYEEFTVAWNKLYPRKYFEDIRYPKGKIHEDEFTTYKLLEKASRIAYIEYPLYYYVQRGNSIMGESFNEKRLHRLDAYNQRLEQYWNQRKYDWYERILFLYRIFLVRYTKEIDKRDDIDIRILEKYKRNYNRFVLKSLFKLPIGMKQKVGYAFYAVLPKLYQKRQ